MSQICSLSGMCTNLHETYERKFPYVSDPDAESASDEHTAGVANVGDQDASPERQLNPKSPENADAPPEHQLVSCIYPSFMYISKFHEK